MNSFSREGLMRAAAMVTGSTYVTYAVGLVASALVARALGPADFGRYSYLLWLSGVLVILSNNGLTTSAIRFIAECSGRTHDEGAAAVHRWVSRWNWLSAIGVTAGAMLLLPWMLPQGWTHGAATFGVALSAVVVSKAAFLMNVSVAKGYGRFSLEVKVNVTLSALNLIGVVLLKIANASLIGYVSLFAAVSVSYWLLSRVLLEREGVPPSTDASLNAELRSRLTLHLRWTIALVVLGSLAGRSIETFLLNLYATAEDLAYFAVAASLTRGGIDLLMSGLQTVLMPAMAHAYGSGTADAVRRLLGTSLRHVSTLGLLAAGVGVLLAEPAITLLYGASYVPAIWVMKVIAVIAGLALSEGVFGAYLSTTDNQRSRVVALVASVAVNALLAIALVPEFGLTGAVISYGAGRACSIAVLCYMILYKDRVRLEWRSVAKLSLSAGLAFAVAYTLSEQVDGMVVDVLAAAVYVGLFATFAALLRCWPTSEYDLVLEFASRSPSLDGTAGTALRAARRILRQLRQGVRALRHRAQLRRKLAALCGIGVVGRLLGRVHDRGTRPLLILAYHRVMPLPDPATYPFDLDLISATPEAFDQQMQFLRSEFDPVTMPQLVDHVTHGTPLPPRPVLVTFDDGYTDNLDIAGPIMAKHGIVPTIFVATAQVGSTEPYWFEWLSYLMMRLPPGAIESPALEAKLPRGDDWQLRREDTRTLQSHFKRARISEIWACIEEWKMRFGEFIDPREFRLTATLDWPRIVAADGNGFHFESHSVSHGILSTMTPTELQRELVDSRRELEVRLKREVRSIAYPVGKQFAYTDAVLAAVEHAGYVIAASYMSGSNDLGRLARFELRRQNVEWDHGLREFISKARCPRWFP
jgi:O-antigen/teichoic acid export membrane protein/peptidoglycan/xylan/chitin deacetylase (PgdA/CDA1 family)